MYDNYYDQIARGYSTAKLMATCARWRRACHRYPRLHREEQLKKIAVINENITIKKEDKYARFPVVSPLHYSVARFRW